MKYTTIIFDFDGVIGDTYDINYGLSQSLVGDVSEQDFIDHHKGNVFAEPKINFLPEHIPVYFERQKQQFTREHLFPIVDLLEPLSEKFQLFIISSTIDENISHFLSLGSYNQYFKNILGATVHRSKVEKFKMIFNVYGLSPDQCLFVTDTVGDIIEARNVGVDVVGVTWGYHDEDLLRAEGPRAIIHTPEELMNAISELG